MRLLEAIRRANRPGMPADSLPLRLACSAAVLVAIAAARSQAEFSLASAVSAMSLVAVGTVFSHRTRRHPPGWVKVVLAVAAVVALVVFFQQVRSQPVSDVTEVQDPLATLFVWVLAIHSFHVPVRRDLAFSLFGGAALLAISGAQAIDLRFAAYAVGWAGLTLWALYEMWSSASDGGEISARAVTASLGAVAVFGVTVFLILPAPRVSVRVDFLSRPGSAGAVAVPGALAGDAASPTELAHPGSPGARIAVGGYLGFADRLDTALRGSLGNQVVMRVRADRPSFWVGQTYDTWDGQSWTSTAAADRAIQRGSPSLVFPGDGEIPLGTPDLQTFFVASSTPNLVFHAETATQVWFPAPTLSQAPDGTMVSPIGLGKGAVYTVESAVDTPGPARLRAATGPNLTASVLPHELQLPHPYPQVEALAASVTAGTSDTYDKVEALIAWIGSHTRYSTDIPPLPPGGDTVDSFLFGSRVGFCEQISTSLAVMLRSLGIPARETVGYVPGPYNPITDLYQVQAKDAHAWVQVWFPSYGWQSFDPTASVPLANPTPGSVALHDLGHALSRIPVLPSIVVVVAAGLVALVLVWWRRRPKTWAERVTREIERAGDRAGRRRRVDETIVEYAAILDANGPGPPGHWSEQARLVAVAAYGPGDPPPT